MDAYDLLEHWAERAAIMQYDWLPEPVDDDEALGFQVRAEMEAAAIVFNFQFPDRYALEQYLNQLRNEAKSTLKRWRAA